MRTHNKINIETQNCIGKHESVFPHFITLDDCDMFSSIAKMKICRNRIFILDDNTSILHVFDLSGKFIGKIDNVGQGPGKYIHLRDFELKDNCIYLYDDRARRILVYDLQSLEFITSSETPFFARAFYLLGNGNILFVLPKDQGEKQLVVTDSLYHILNEYIEFDPDDMDNRSRYSLLQETDKGVVYAKPESNNVYLLSKENGALLEKYHFLIDGKDYNKNKKPTMCCTQLHLYWRVEQF